MVSMMPPQSVVGTRFNPAKPPASSGAAMSGSRIRAASPTSLRVSVRRTGISMSPTANTESIATMATRQRSEAG